MSCLQKVQSRAHNFLAFSSQHTIVPRATIVHCTGNRSKCLQEVKHTYIIESNAREKFLDVCLLEGKRTEFLDVCLVQFLAPKDASVNA